MTNELDLCAIDRGEPAGRLEPLLSNWYDDLALSAVQRVSIGIIGDSITEGLLTTNLSINPFAVGLRYLMQTRYGAAGEGFISCLHTDTNFAATPRRWSFSGAEWDKSYSGARTGKGIIAGGKSTSGTTQMSIVTRADQVIAYTSTNHVGGGNLGVYVDGVLQATQDCLGDGSDDLDYTKVISLNNLSNIYRTIMFKRDSTGLVTLQGIRSLIGSTGVVVDRFGKGAIRTAWLGDVNENDPVAEFYQALHFVETIGSNLWIIALGINDYVNQESLNTFETALTTIVQRCKTVAPVAILALPQPNSSLTTPYSSYVTRMNNVATAQGCPFWNVRERWGNVFVSAWMADLNHPNDAGHTDIAHYIFSRIRL